jgi:hypothetical protein
LKHVSVRALILAAVVAGASCIGSSALARAHASVVRSTFTGPDGLITNEYATWEQNDPLAFRSNLWYVESGSLFRRNNHAWTGVPTCGHPDRTSSTLTGSGKLRVQLLRRVPRDQLVTFGLRVKRFTDGCDRRPARKWDGVKIYLRRLDGDNFYTAEVSLRDGHAYIQKKIGGRYRVLAAERDHRAAFGKWEDVGGSVHTNPGGSVTIEVIRRGRVVLRARDRGAGGPPITQRGLTGFRSDNTAFSLDNFTVSRAP